MAVVTYPDCPLPGYRGIAYHLGRICEEGGLSSGEVCDLVDGLEPYGWEGCGNEDRELHVALVALLRVEPFGYCDFKLAHRMALRLAQLAEEKATRRQNAGCLPEDP